MCTGYLLRISTKLRQRRKNRGDFSFQAGIIILWRSENNMMMMMMMMVTTLILLTIYSKFFLLNKTHILCAIRIDYEIPMDDLFRELANTIDTFMNHRVSRKLVNH